MANLASRASRLTGRAGSAALSARRTSTRPVASTSTQTVASGISRRERDSLSAAARRAPRSGIRARQLVGRVRRRAPPLRRGQLGDGLPDVLAAHHPVGAGSGEGGQVEARVFGLLADQRRDHATRDRAAGALPPEPARLPAAEPVAGSVRARCQAAGVAGRDAASAVVVP